MRLLVTGVSGLLGSAVARLGAAAGHEIIGTVGRWAQTVPGVTRQAPIDLADEPRLAALLRETGPEAVVNCAALAEPAACDANPALAEKVNVALPATLAHWVATNGARLLHVSTEQVFDGESAPYRTSDAVKPLHLYGRQKAEAERRVLVACPGAAVLRIPLLFGNSLGGRRSVHEKFLETWATGRVMRLFTDEVRAVCSAESVATALLELALRPDLTGLLHWTGARPVSRHEMGRAICARFGFPETWIEAVPRSAMPEFTATRPRDLTLDLAPLDRELKTRPEDFEETVAGLVLPPWWRELESPDLANPELQ